MKLHRDKEVFTQAILSTAEYFNIQEVFVEKDYWVTYVLKNLSQSKYKGTVVFKGGTSLSKAYRLINRFSEDIDLAIIQSKGASGNAIKNLIKSVEAEMAVAHVQRHALPIVPLRAAKTAMQTTLRATCNEGIRL